MQVKILNLFRYPRDLTRVLLLSPNWIYGFALIFYPFLVEDCLLKFDKKFYPRMWKVKVTAWRDEHPPPEGIVCSKTLDKARPLFCHPHKAAKEFFLASTNYLWKLLVLDAAKLYALFLFGLCYLHPRACLIWPENHHAFCYLNISSISLQ